MNVEIAQKILKYFEIEEKVISLEHNQTGLINRTFEIETLDNRFIIQEINKYVFSNYKLSLQNIILVNEWINQSDYQFKFPSPIKNKYFNFNNKVFRLLPYVHQSKVIDKITDINQAKEAAHCLSNFYTSLDNFPVEKLNFSIPNFHNGKEKILGFKDALQNACKQRLNNSKTLIKEVESKINILNKWDYVCKKLPLRVVHYDTKINNFLFSKSSNKVIALIDFDTLMPGCILSDVGDMIRSYSNLSGEENEDFNNILCDFSIVDIIIDTFKSNRSLQNEELNNMYFGGVAVTFMQTVRFLTDYLNGNKYYKVSYENQNLNRALNQWNLYLSLIKYN